MSSDRQPAATPEPASASRFRDSICQRCGGYEHAKEGSLDFPCKCEAASDRAKGADGVRPQWSGELRGLRVRVMPGVVARYPYVEFYDCLDERWSRVRATEDDLRWCALCHAERAAHEETKRALAKAQGNKAKALSTAEWHASECRIAIERAALAEQRALGAEARANRMLPFRRFVERASTRPHLHCDEGACPACEARDLLVAKGRVDGGGGD